MISLFSKLMPLILTSNILVIAISYNLVPGQSLKAFDVNEKSCRDSTLSCERIAADKNKDVEIDMSYPVTIGILSALVLASISYTLEDEPRPEKESFNSKSTSAILGAIVGFVAGFFITGAIMEIKAKREAKRETEQYNIYQVPSISVKRHVRIEPYLENYRHGNQCGINLQFQF